MTFNVTVTGRRFSDNGDYELRLTCDAPTEKDVQDHLEEQYDWEDAATRHISVVEVH